jgi:hypothetical protein
MLLCCDEIRTLIIQNDFLIRGRKFISLRLYAVLNLKSITDALFLSLTICFLYASFLIRLLYVFTTSQCHILIEVFLNLTEVFLTLTEVFPCFFLSCKANARVKLAKTGHGPHSTTLVCICVVRMLLFVLFGCYLCCSMCCCIVCV